MDLENHDLLTWADIYKILAGFVVSILLLFVKAAVERWYRRNLLMKGAWCIAKSHDQYRDFENLLNDSELANASGSVFVASVDISDQYGKILAELMSLDPTNADKYINYISTEEIIRAGFKNLAALKFEILKGRTAVPSPDSELISLKRGVAAQCQALRKDLLGWARKELLLLEHLQSLGNGDVEHLQNIRAAVAVMSGVMDEKV